MLAKKNPIFGAGYRNTEWQMEEIKKQFKFGQVNFEAHAHNNYLEILSATGIFGFIPFILFLIFWFKESSINKGGRLLAIPLLVNFCILSLFQSTINDSIGLYLLIMFYLISQCARETIHRPISPAQKMFA